MDESKIKFEDGTRVKLRDGVDSTFYAGMAKVGCEGWITKHRQDRFGLPEVYIQWDQTHWAYNRQPDCWTFEDHFEIVKGKTVEQPTNPGDMSPQDARFFSMMRKLWDEVQENPEPETPDAADEADMESYRESLQTGIDSLEDTEAFITVAIKRSGNGHNVVVCGEALGPEADILLGVQLSALGAKFHQDAALLHLHMMEFPEEDHGGS